MARPTKRTPEREERLFSALRDGNTRRAACAVAGISETTLADWLRRFCGFRESIERAEGQAEATALATVVSAMRDGTWQAGAWWLERRRPDDFARRDKIEVTVRQHAEKLAAEMGLDADDLIAEAERIVASAQ